MRGIAGDATTIGREPRAAATAHAAPGHSYRPEIEGLRAVAVLPVILFPAGISGFSVGYVGVDVFFVISGYLITSIILRERVADCFSLSSFYEPRARRILPALFLVMLVCIPLAWFWMLPDELVSFGQTLAAVSVFGSNVLFWLTTGYFIRWTLRLYPLDRAIDALAFDNHEGGVEMDTPYRRNRVRAADGTVSAAASVKVSALRAYLATLAAAKPLVVLYQVPEVGWFPPSRNLAERVMSGAIPAEMSTSAMRYRTRNAVAIDALNSINAPMLRRSHPSKIFCNTMLPGRCAIQADGKLYYSDDDHLSALGAQALPMTACAIRHRQSAPCSRRA